MTWITNSTPARASASTSLRKSVATCALDLFEEFHEALHPFEPFGRCLPQALLDLARIDARRHAPEQFRLPGKLDRVGAHRVFKILVPALRCHLSAPWAGAGASV